MWKKWKIFFEILFEKFQNDFTEIKMKWKYVNVNSKWYYYKYKQKRVINLSVIRKRKIRNRRYKWVFSLMYQRERRITTLFTHQINFFHIKRVYLKKESQKNKFKNSNFKRTKKYRTLSKFENSKRGFFSSIRSSNTIDVTTPVTTSATSPKRPLFFLRRFA